MRVIARRSTARKPIDRYRMLGSDAKRKSCQRRMIIIKAIDARIIRIEAHWTRTSLPTQVALASRSSPLSPARRYSTHGRPPGDLMATQRRKRGRHRRLVTSAPPFTTRYYEHSRDAVIANTIIAHGSLLAERVLSTHCLLRRLPCLNSAPESMR